MIAFGILEFVIGLFWAMYCVARRSARGYHDRFGAALTFIINFLFWWITIPVSLFCQIVLGRETLFQEPKQKEKGV